MLGLGAVICEHIISQREVVCRVRAARHQSDEAKLRTAQGLYFMLEISTKEKIWLVSSWESLMRASN